MTKIVIKFGGTSVGSVEKIIAASKIVQKEHKKGNEIIVVVSAMAGQTNQLINNAKKISKNFNARELDVLLASGEQVTAALMAGALNELKIDSKTWLSWQIPILTEGNNNNSRIININIEKINKFITKKGVAIIPGFQGISKNGDLTTIGRGGSDASAVAVAKTFNTDYCEIYTDVDGVYSTDPKNFPVAKKIDKISYEEMLEMSSLGAKVMQASAVQTAMMYDIPLHVRSTFTGNEGTKIFNSENIDYTKTITGVTYSKDDAKITLQGVEDKPGVAADIFEPLGKNGINVDMVIQNISPDGKKTDLTFTIKRQDLASTIKLIEDNRKKITFLSLSKDDKVSKISIIGAGMITTPGVTYKMFRSLADESVNILAISTSEIKISVIINEAETSKAIKKLHTVFNLD
ncbi:aspartate kinase [Pelagibacteraceae bacterium]|jgi:aspartate kinase|nr:aspartate kinase [Pelagibacteraceae bacterium]|tara:strand:+ start:4383 stop:5597 length:1215 start_codon:yes stop_codon:yes gene_type:complete